MKNIKSLADIETLKGTNVPEKVKAHIKRYFKMMMRLYGNDYNSQESGWIILLEQSDPLKDVMFLEEKLGIRGGCNLVSIIKEFVDYDSESNLFEVFALYNDEFGMIFLIPDEGWVGEELLNHLRTFQNDPENYNDQKPPILN